MLEATLDHDEARSAYRHLGGALNLAGRYEDIATRRLLPHARFDVAEQVFEFGCGTGRHAEQLLREVLPARARYTAIDLTPEMVAATRRRLAHYGERAQVRLSNGGPPSAEPDGAYDRFVSNYVFDLLPPSEIRAVLAEAHRMLRPGGLICLSGLAPAQGPLSRMCIGLWSAVYRLRPQWVGGCRPIELAPFIDSQHWTLRHREIVTPLGFPLEIIVAEKRSA